MMEMIRVLRGNQEKMVSSLEKERYLKQGYNVIDEEGAVIEQGVKSNHVLKTELDAANKRIAEVEAENAELKRRIAEVEAENAELKRRIAEVEAENAEPEKKATKKGA